MIKKNFLNKTLKIIALMCFLLSFDLVRNSSAKEQWEGIDYENSFELVDDVNFDQSNKSLIYDRDPNSLNKSPIGGAAWIKKNISSTKGLKVSMEVDIKYDINFTGNVKYPQGFAVVLTQSPFTGLIGRKNSGISYDTIQKSIVLEFDLVQNLDQGDSNFATLSVKYNLDGPVSSSQNLCDTKDSEEYERVKNICNVKLPNFFDPTLPFYEKVKTLNIEFIGGKLNVNFDDKLILIDNNEFKIFDKLMKESSVYIGITSSMNLYKGLTIKNLNLRSVTILKFPEIDLTTEQISFPAGSDISLDLKLLSLARTKLVIYNYEFKKIRIFMNNVETNSYSVNFIESLYLMRINLKSLEKVGVINIKFQWEDLTSPNLINLTITPGINNRLKILEPSILPGTNKLSYIGKSDQKFYRFKILITDQYGNVKNPNNLLSDIKSLITIQNPLLFIINRDDIFISAGEDQMFITLDSPINSVGEFRIFSEEFLDGMEKVYEIVSSGINSDLSYTEISKYYEVKRSKISDEIKLNVILYDSFRSLIDTEQLKNLNIKVSLNRQFQEEKEIISINKEQFTYLDKKLEVNYKISKVGYYFFSVTIQNENDAKEIKCFLCDFFVPTNEVDYKNLLVWSNYYKTYVLSSQLPSIDMSIENDTESKDTTSEKYLVISLDTLLRNENNFFVFKFVDTSRNPIELDKIDELQVKFNLENEKGEQGDLNLYPRKINLNNMI